VTERVSRFFWSRDEPPFVHKWLSVIILRELGAVNSFQLPLTPGFSVAYEQHKGPNIRAMSLASLVFWLFSPFESWTTFSSH